MTGERAAEPAREMSVSNRHISRIELGDALRPVDLVLTRRWRVHVRLIIVPSL
jgi:hypothetical protein